jgi:hypothetical protein
MASLRALAAGHWQEGHERHFPENLLKSQFFLLNSPKTCQ